MQIAHLTHDDCGIRCKGCGNRFEVPSRALGDPEFLVQIKEAIAAKHTCKSYSAQAPELKAADMVSIRKLPDTGESLSPVDAY